MISKYFNLVIKLDYTTAIDCDFEIEIEITSNNCKNKNVYNDIIYVDNFDTAIQDTLHSVSIGLDAINEKIQDSINQLQKKIDMMNSLLMD